jgi:hypothetical protein
LVVVEQVELMLVDHLLVKVHLVLLQLYQRQD